jgi:uncharacterized protein
MNIRRLFPALVLAFFLCTAHYLRAQTPVPADVLQQLQQIAIIEQKLMMPMRDGVRLATDVYRPKTDSPVPIIFSKTPYNFNNWGDGEQRAGTYQAALDAVKRGYAYVVQNERGKFFSEGDWDILGPPTTDGYDAFSWMKKQPWSNGKIGTLGCSSTAEWQMAVAALDHPAHAALVPMGFGAGVGRVGSFVEQGNWYRGGAQQMLFTTWLYGTQTDAARPIFPKTATSVDLTRASRFYDMAPEMPKVDWAQGLRHLPVQDIIKQANGQKGVYEKMIVRQPNDPDWYKGGLYHDNMPFNKPSYWFVSWYDVSSSPNLALFNHVRKSATDVATRDAQFLVIAPTLHCAYKRATANTVVGERSVGDARLDYDGLIYGWFDYWLKGEQNDVLTKTPRVRYYTMGSNKWQTSETWPPAEAAMTTYFLSSGGRANSLYGDGKLSPTPPASNQKADVFAYDPAYPVPSYGGNVCCTGTAIQGGAFDQHQMETRQDILVYTTEPFADGVELTGSVETTLYVGSDAKDTDFTVKLIDVYPDGRAYNLDETILRARYREGFDKEVMMENGKVYKLTLSPMATSNFFAPGHRIRVEVSSSNFPRFDRNLNTGGKNYDESKGVVANNKVFHTASYPSQIRLPLVKK